MQGDNRIAWREGIFLRPQHFQQQDRFVDSLVRARTERLRPYPWGLVEFKLDQNLASLGKFAAEQLVGLMPDGQPFAAPADLPLPEPLDIPADTRNAVIYLTLPARQAGAVEFQPGDQVSDTVRYLIEEESVMDAASQTRTPQTVEVARPNLRFGVTRSQTEGRVRLGLAKIREVQNNRLVFDDDYIPSCLDIRASARLAGMPADIIGRGQLRAAELALRAVESVEGGSDAFASYFMLTALGRWVPTLEHLKSTPMIHPERLFEVFAAMAGELSTLATEERRGPAHRPYDHEDLQASFEPLFDRLQLYLSWTPGRSAELLTLEDKGYGRYVSPIRDSNLYRDGTFFLAVRAGMALDEIRARFPAMAKIGAMEKMPTIMKAALPGVPLRHTPTPPPQLRALPGYVYFELDRSAPDWRDFARSSALGLHVAGEWPSLKLELWCVKRKDA